MTRHMPRWAVSLADLTMVLLGFFVILHAAGPRVAAGAVRSAFGSGQNNSLLLEEAADRLFDPDEARLTATGRERLRQIGSKAGKSMIVVESFGRSAASKRLDGWELAAARSAAVAHALTEAGVSENRISILMPDGDFPASSKGQTIVVRRAG